jgi:hypothetical protein
MVLFNVCRGTIFAAATLHLIRFVVANAEETQRVLWHAFDPKLHASLSQKDECKGLWTSTKAQSYMNDWNTAEISSDINNFNLWPGNDYGMCSDASALSTMMICCSTCDDTL